GPMATVTGEGAAEGITNGACAGPTDGTSASVTVGDAWALALGPPLDAAAGADPRILHWIKPTAASTATTTPAATPATNVLRFPPPSCDGRVSALPVVAVPSAEPA